MRGTLIWLSLLGALVSGCASSPTPDVAAVETRIAATLQAIPTAAPLVITLTVPPPPPPLPPSPTAAAPAPTPPQPPAEPVEYVVQRGDTLSTIAQRFNTSMAAIQILNNIEDVRVIRVGQRLKIPTQRLAEDESPYWVAHRVRPGETLSMIAQRYRVALRDVLRVNRLGDPSRVIAGQWLVIPTRAPVAP